MAEMQQKVGALTSFGGVTKLASLPNNRCRMIGYLDWSSDEYPNAKMHFGMSFKDVSPTDGGSIGVYLMSSLNGTNWSGDVTPQTALTGAAFVRDDQLSVMKLIKSIPVDNSCSDTTVVWVCNDLAKEVGDLPEYWGIAVDNQSGATFTTDYYCQYQYYTYET
jgi:hypothetical protein